MAATIGWGFFILSITGLRKEMPDILHIVFYSGIIGIIILGHLILILGLLGYLGKGILYLTFFLGFTAGMYALFLMKRKKPNIPNHFESRSGFSFNKRFKYLLLLLCIPYIILIFCHDLTPDLSGDAYLYHITVPRYYALEGKIGTLPVSFCYNYPLQIEMYYLAGLRWGQEQSGVMMNFAILGLTCLGIILMGRYLNSSFAGFVSVYLFLSLPIVLRWAPTSLVDLSTAPFLLGSFLALLRWQKKKSGIWLLLAGFCAGGAIAVKLFLGIAAFLLIPLVLILSSIVQERHPCSAKILSLRFAPISMANCSRLVKNLFLYTAGVMIPLLPWMMKNALMTYNPVFPFALSRFPTRPDLILSALQLHAMHGIPKYKSLWYLLKSAWGSFSLFSWDGNWIIISAMVFSPFFFIFSLKTRNRRMFWGFQVLIVLLMLYYGTNAQVRWFQGYFPFLVIAFSLAVEDLIQRFPSIRKTLLSFLLVLTFVNAGWYFYLQLGETYLLPWTGFTRKSLTLYLKDKDRVKEASFLNRHLPHDAKVLLFDMEIVSTGRWMERRFYQAGEALFNRWVKNRMDVSSVLKELRNMRITHISGLRSGNNPIFRQLKKEYLKETAFEEPYTLYEIKYPKGN